MATETLAPDALIDQTGLTGAVTDIDESVDSPDANWLTAAINTATVCRASFPTPTGPPTVGAGLQTIRAWVRKNASSDPTAVLALRETGGGANLAETASTAIFSATGQMLPLTFNASLLATADGSAVEAYITGTPSSGGAASNRASVEIGAVEWNVEYTVVSNDKSGTASIYGGGAVSASGINPDDIDLFDIRNEANIDTGSGQDQWTSIVVADGTISHDTPGLGGSDGKVAIAIITSSTASRYLRKTWTALTANDFFLRFYINQGTLAVSSGSTSHEIVEVYSNSGSLARIVIRLVWTGSLWRFLGMTRADDDILANTGNVERADGAWPEYIEVHLRKESNDTAGDGFLRMYFDGVQVGSEISSLDNFDNFCLDELWIGHARLVDAELTGTMYIDEVKATKGAASLAHWKAVFLVRRQSPAMAPYRQREPRVDQVLPAYPAMAK